ncbi:MAG: 3-dehydroquinate synthase [bacterium]|nr:3-dehydroquinate synthase [bacterium]
MTRTVEVATEPPYTVHVGPGLLDRVDAAARHVTDARRIAVVCDERVDELHGTSLLGLEDAPRLRVPGEEASKSFAGLEGVLNFFSSAGLGRGDCVVTLGGGVVSDLGGLAASMYKRGIDVVHAPTTLLSQVDASVGGKTAINLAAGKNLAGTFHQPRAVLADTETLATLPEPELASGFGEVLKTSLIGGETSLAKLEELAPALAARDASALGEIVADCVAVKARIVAEDPGEQGPRRALNLGHTFAHGIEHAADYGKVPHGVAVAVGIGLALGAASALGLEVANDLAPRVDALSTALGLPASLSALRQAAEVELGADAILAGMAHDKKGRVGTPELVLVLAPGKLELGVQADTALLSKILAT